MLIPPDSLKGLRDDKADPSVVTDWGELARRAFGVIPNAITGFAVSVLFVDTGVGASASGIIPVPLLDKGAVSFRGVTFPLLAILAGVASRRIAWGEELERMN